MSSSDVPFPLFSCFFPFIFRHMLLSRLAFKTKSHSYPPNPYPLLFFTFPPPLSLFRKCEIDFLTTMSSSDGPLPSPDRRGLRTLLRLRKPPASSSADQNPLLISSPPPLPIKKKAFASAAFRSLSCSSSSAASQAYAPSSSAAAAVRSSADWEGKRARRRRTNQKKKKKDRSSAAASDVWCAPGISFVGDDSVDCVVSHREMAGRGARVEAERALRERTYYGRRAGNQEPVSSMADSKSSPRASLYGSDLTPSDHYRHMRGYYHQPPVELEEIMLLHHRLLLRGGDTYDRYRDWRLDVDDMTYEELLELGDKIGHVSTGLREEEIECSIRKVKHSIFAKLLSIEMERKCSICQEEYEMDDEVGKLDCGHSYHIYCIRKWLLQKNTCPVCKTAVSKI